MFCFFLKSTYVFLGCFVLSKGVSLTYIVRGRRCRPFDILRTSFSRHIMRVSALRYSSLVVQSTHHVGVGCSALSVMHSADRLACSLVSESPSWADARQKSNLSGVVRFSVTIQSTDWRALGYLNHHPGLSPDRRAICLVFCDFRYPISRQQLVP